MSENTVSKKLALQGWELPEVAKPVAAYTPAISLPGPVPGTKLVRTSGQIPVRDGLPLALGRVRETSYDTSYPGEFYSWSKKGVFSRADALSVSVKPEKTYVTAEVAKRLAGVCALNALAAAAQVAGGLDKIQRVLKVTVFVASHKSFSGQAAVANGVSELFGKLFDEPHIRSAVGVAVLPLNVPVEVEVEFLVEE